MQEILNNCFGSKKYSMTLRQAKTGKHKCWNVIPSFLHLMVLFYKVIFNHTSKHQFAVWHFRMDVIQFLIVWRQCNVLVLVWDLFCSISKLFLLLRYLITFETETSAEEIKEQLCTIYKITNISRKYYNSTT